MHELWRTHIRGGMLRLIFWAGWDCVLDAGLDVRRTWIKTVTLGPFDLTWKRDRDESYEEES